MLKNPMDCDTLGVPIEEMSGFTSTGDGVLVVKDTLDVSIATLDDVSIDSTIQSKMSTLQTQYHILKAYIFRHYSCSSLSSHFSLIELERGKVESTESFKIPTWFPHKSYKGLKMS